MSQNDDRRCTDCGASHERQGSYWVATCNCAEDKVDARIKGLYGQRMPKRIQLKRTKGWRIPDGCVNVARPTKFGNPFHPRDYHPEGHGPYHMGVNGDWERASPPKPWVTCRNWAAHDFHVALTTGPWPKDYPSLDVIRTELRGKDLACWCPVDARCHADTLLALANDVERTVLALADDVERELPKVVVVSDDDDDDDDLAGVPPLTQVTPPPAIGQMVIYRSKIDNGPGNDVFSPAVVIRTKATTVPAVVERWGSEPRKVVSIVDPSITHETTVRPDGFVAVLPDDRTVDLVVFGLGQSYREYHVRCGDGPGQWSPMTTVT